MPFVHAVLVFAVTAILTQGCAFSRGTLGDDIKTEAVSSIKKGVTTKTELLEALTGVELGPLTLTPGEAVSLRSSGWDCPLRFVDESSGDPSHLV